MTPAARAARPSRAVRWIRVAAAAACIAACAFAPARGQAPSAVTERGVKAAFVYKFLGYVEWPQASAQPDAPIVVGVVGADDLAGELADAVRGRTVGTRAVEVRRLRATDSLAGLHALFIGNAEKARIGPLARAAQQQRGVLVITESPDALDAGSIINLIVVDGRVRFEVSLDAAERAGLKLSSRMLAVAHLVRMGNN